MKRTVFCLISTVIYAAQIHAMTVADLALLSSQEYVDAREMMIAEKEPPDSKPANVREAVTLRSIVIRRSNPKTGGVLLTAERAAPGVYTGRIQAPEWWQNVVGSNIKDAGDKFFLFAEAFLFKTFRAWNQRDYEQSCGSLVDLALECRGMSAEEKGTILIEVIKDYKVPVLQDMMSRLGTHHFHLGEGFELVAFIVFHVQENLLNSAILPLVRNKARPHHDEWDDHYLRKHLESSQSIIKGLIGDAVTRKRPDVIIVLADGLRANGLALLDFAKFFNKPAGDELLKAFEDASQKLDNDDLKKSVQRLTEAIAAYPANEKKAFAPAEQKK